MAMLAERKQRVKWSLNPRGNDWAKDSTKFGQKMLEKMGWSPGKGLGANEQGIKAIVKTSYKSNSKGFGWKENGEEWLKQQASFSDLLAELSESNKEIDIPVKPSSLEEKSKKTKRRVHYQKFTRGKDLSRYSNKDLTCIVGLPDVKEPPEESNQFHVVCDAPSYFSTKNFNFYSNSKSLQGDQKELGFNPILFQSEKRNIASSEDQDGAFVDQDGVSDTNSRNIKTSRKKKRKCEINSSKDVGCVDNATESLNEDLVIRKKNKRKVI